MARVKITSGNRPHQGHGHKSRPSRMKGLMAGSHVAQRTNTGFDDRTGYKNTPKLGTGTESGRAPKAPREAGHYHPLHVRSATKGVGFDVGETRKLQRKDHDERDQGYHTGREARADTRRKDGPVGNGLGSPPPGVGKGGKGVSGSPNSHLGTAGRGGPGKLGKGDGFKGQNKPHPEDLSHGWFEKLGSG